MPQWPEQPRLDVLGGQRLSQQRVVEQVDLPDGEVVRGSPVGVQLGELLLGQRAVRPRPPGLSDVRVLDRRCHRSPLIGTGSDVPDLLAVLADRAVRGELAHAGHVEDRHARPAPPGRARARSTSSWQSM